MGLESVKPIVSSVPMVATATAQLTALAATTAAEARTLIVSTVHQLHRFSQNVRLWCDKSFSLPALTPAFAGASVFVGHGNGMARPQQRDVQTVFMRAHPRTTPRATLERTIENKGAYAAMQIRYILSTRYSCYPGNDSVMSSLRHLIKTLVDEVQGQDALEMLAILENRSLTPEMRYERLNVFKSKRAVRQHFGL